MGQSEGTVVFLGMVPLTRAYSSHGVWNLDFLAATSGPPCPRSGICTGICTFVGGTLTAHVFFFLEDKREMSRVTACFWCENALGCRASARDLPMSAPKLMSSFARRPLFA